MKPPMVVSYNQADWCTLSGGVWSTTLPLSRLLTPTVSEVARTASSNHASTWFKATGGVGPARVFAIVRENLVGPLPGVTPSEAAQFRIRTIFGSYGSPATFYARSLPSAILASTNLTGTVSAIQGADLENPPGTWLTAASPTANTDLRVSLQAASCSLLTGSNLQTVLLLLRRTSGGGSNPTVVVEVYKSGVFAGTLISGAAVSSTTGTLMSLLWNASILGGSPPASSGVELRVRGTASATATVEIGGIQWLPEYASNGTASVTDSGWLNPPLPNNYWGPKPPQTRLRRQLTLAHITLTAIDWNEAIFEFHAAGNYGGYFEGGKVVIGDGVTFVDGRGEDTPEDFGLVYREIDPSIKERSSSGSPVSQRLTGWREIDVQFSAVSAATSRDRIVDNVDVGGITREKLWLFRPDSLADPDAVLWGTQRELKDISPFTNTTYSRGFTVEESV